MKKNKTSFRVILFLVFFLSLCGQKNSPSTEKIQIYHIPPFSNPYNTMKGASLVDALNIKLMKNEFGYRFFVIKNNTKRFINNINVKIVPLNKQKKNSKIQKIDIFIVKPWFQLTQPSFINKKNITHSFVPELFLKDDTEMIHPGKWLNNHYIPPSINHKFNTTIGPSKFKMICVIINPLDFYNNINNGFKYTIQITSENKQLKKIPLSISIMPFNLPEHKKIKAIYYFATLDKESNGYLTPDKMKKQLKLIRRYGFNSLFLYEQNAEILEQMLKLTKDCGFKGPFVLNRPKVFNKSASNKIKKIFNGYNYYIIGTDEPNKPRKFKAHIKNSKKIHALGHKVFTALKINTEKKLRLKNELLEWANFNIKNLHAEKLMEHKALPGQLQTYYWQCYMEIPALNRLYSGFFLHYSQVDGIFPFIYQLVWSYAMPYASDTREHNIIRVREKKPYMIYKNFFTVYPISDGHISTLQWEAFRRGDDDLKLCLLFTNFIKIIHNKDIDKARVVKQDFHKKLRKLCGPYQPNLLLKYNTYENELNKNIESLRLWMINILYVNKNIIND